MAQLHYSGTTKDGLLQKTSTLGIFCVPSELNRCGKMPFELRFNFALAKLTRSIAISHLLHFLSFQNPAIPFLQHASLPVQRTWLEEANFFKNSLDFRDDLGPCDHCKLFGSKESQPRMAG